MPAPVVVYVVAVLATFSAIWAFNEFVYEPHIHPQFQRLVEEYEENRRRRRMARAQARNSDDGRPFMAQQQRRANDDDSDEEHYGPPDSKRQYVKDFELTDFAPEVREWRRTSGETLRLRKNAGQTNSLDESNYLLSIPSLQPAASWRPWSVRGVGAATASATPLAGRSSMNTPQAPAHVLGDDPDSPTTTTTTTSTATSTVTSTPTGTPHMARRMQDLPRLPPSATDHAEVGPSTWSSLLFSTEQAKQSPMMERREVASPSQASVGLSSLVTSPPLPPLPAIVSAPSPVPAAYTTAQTNGAPSYVRNTMPMSPPLRRESGDLSPPLTARPVLSPRNSLSSGASPTKPYQHHQQPIASPPSHSRSTSRSIGVPSSPFASPSLSGHGPPIPSLSQIYPQELDYEHGVVLLSPPSSRSDSPFSVISNGGVGGRDSHANFSGGLGRGTPDIGGTRSSTPGSAASTNYLSLSEDGEGSASLSRDGSRASSSSSVAAAHPQSRAFGYAQYEQQQQQQIRGVRSPLVPGDADDSEDEFDFDVLSNSDPSMSPYALSPFSSPLMATISPSISNSNNNSSSRSPPPPPPPPRRAFAGHVRYLSRASSQQQQQQSNRPVSPAVSTTSTMLSDLDLMEDVGEYGWRAMPARRASTEGARR